MQSDTRAKAFVDPGVPKSVRRSEIEQPAIVDVYARALKKKKKGIIRVLRQCWHSFVVMGLQHGLSSRWRTLSSFVIGDRADSEAYHESRKPTFRKKGPGKGCYTRFTTVER